MSAESILRGIVALVFAALLSLVTTPAARELAIRLNAIDVPKDDRRMHRDPVPLLGGLAVFFAVCATSLLFGARDSTVASICLGGAVVVAGGMLDDLFDLPPLVKLLFQAGGCAIALLFGVRIEFMSIFGGNYFSLGPVGNIFLTALWVLLMTNAFNIIDGLDGLVCGVSAISGGFLVVTAFLMSEPQIALLTAAVVGACVGFLPFNIHPAKIFIGDTGAMFLGFALSILSVQGLFKTHMLFAFLPPIVLFAVPLFDTVFAFFRRILKGKNPFEGDKGHIHHRLIALGFSHSQSVLVLYAFCAIFGSSSLVLVLFDLPRALITLGVGLLVLLIDCLLVIKNGKQTMVDGSLPRSPGAEKNEDLQHGSNERKGE